MVRYIAEVRQREFGRLAEGDLDARAESLVTGIYDAVGGYSPATPTQTAFYRAAVDQLNLFVGERENRIAKAGTSIPPPLLGLLIFLAIATITVTLLIKTGHPILDIVLIVAVAIVVAAGLLTALILQYPYSGEISVSTDAFARGSLTHLGAHIG